MKRFLFYLFLSITVFAFGKNKESKLTEYVNPILGTSGHGHTFPATVPFGMVQLSPDTYNEGWNWCSGYHYSVSSIMGFSHIHLSGTGGGVLLDLSDYFSTPDSQDVRSFFISFLKKNKNTLF